MRKGDVLLRVGWPISTLKAAILLSAVLLLLTCNKKQEEEAAPAVIDKSPARVTMAVGKVFAMSRSDGPKARWRKIRVGSPIRVDDIVTTGKESKVDIDIAGQKKVTLGENTLIKIKFDVVQPDRELQVVVAFGQLFGNVRKIIGEGHIDNSFSTPTALASIRGTVFEIVVARLSGESAVRVIKGLVAVRKRIAKKIFAGDSSAAEVRALQQSDYGNADRLSSFFSAIGDDEGVAKRAQLEEEIKIKNAKLRELALSRGYSSQQIEIMVARQTKKLREKLPDSGSEEIVVQAGRQARVSYARSGVLVSQLGVGEIGFLIRLYGEDRIKEALSSDSADKPSGITEPQDSISMLLAKMIEMHLKNKVMQEKEKKSSINKPPSITSKAPLEVYVHNAYAYQIVAADPDSDDLLFSLATAPEGMKISTLTGLINWIPQAPGLYPVKVRIDDGRKGVVEQEFQINVRSIGGSRLEIRPSGGTVATQFRFTCVTAETSAGNAGYRWDFDNDGKWDLPAGEGFSKDRSVAFVFKKRGQYSPRVEIKNSQGISQFLSGKIEISGRPCKVNAGPDQRGNMRSQLSFLGRVIDPDQEMISCSWDFEGDGRQDWEGQFPQNVTNNFGAAGKYSAVFTVRTHSNIYSDTAIVQIINAPPVALTRKEFKTLVGIKATFEGKGSDPDGAIKEYEWDFNGDGVYDWRSNLLGNANHNYSKAGSYRANFRVTGEDGGRAMDTLRVTVFDVNSPEFQEYLKTKE